jgi:hypothetical protein
MRALLGLVALVAVSSTVSAQGGMNGDPDKKAQQAGAMPAGWSLRLDRANAKREEVNFASMGKGLHVTTGPAAVFTNPANTATGPFAFGASFTQMKAPTHPEAYGLMWAGKNLDADGVTYLYYIIRGDGKYMVKHRANATDVHTITDWTESAAIVKQDAAGKATNALEVRVAKDSVRLFANGKPVAAYDAKVMSDNAGLFGIRVNHNLDVHVEGFGRR